MSTVAATQGSSGTLPKQPQDWAPEKALATATPKKQINRSSEATQKNCGNRRASRPSPRFHPDQQKSEPNRFRRGGRREKLVRLEQPGCDEQPAHQLGDPASRQ